MWSKTWDPRIIFFLASQRPCDFPTFTWIGNSRYYVPNLQTIGRFEGYDSIVIIEILSKNLHN